MKKKCADFDVSIDKTNRSEGIPSMLVKQIVGYIADGTLQPGDRLPSELEMTRRFKISRISLREAMKLLEAKGYIESFGKQGKYISSSTDVMMKLPIVELIQNNTKNIKSFFELKRMIFAESAYIAAQRAGDDNIQNMHALLKKVRANFRKKKKDNNEYYTLMMLISQSTGNMVFSHVANSIVDVLRTVMHDSTMFDSSKGSKAFSDTLESVVNAIAIQDPDTAKSSMSLHIEAFETLVS